MTAGRPPKSLAQKLQDGTFRADRANLNEPQPSPFDPTNPFDEEDDIEAYKKWEEIVPELILYGIGKGDRATVEGFCVFYQEALRTRDELKIAEGLPTDDKSRAGRLRTARAWLLSSWDAVKKFAAQLGLDPINRRKVRAPKAGPLGILPGSQGVLPLGQRARDRELGPDDEEPPATTGDPLLDSLM